jgi:UDP-glucose 4-epimerase
LAKRLLITGGAGFIGSHVSEYFLARGWSVDVLDDLSTGKRDNVPPAARLHVLDVRSTDAARLVRESRFDALVHLAAQMDVRKSVADPVFDASVNIVGTLNLLEALRAAPHRATCRFVFASTGGVLYGDLSAPPNRETTAKDPDSPYAIAKLSAEYYLSYLARVHGMDTVALRFGNVYGPRQDPHGEAGVVAIFCGRILEGRPLTIFGDGLQTRDYVYVGDVAAATFIAATHALPAASRVDTRGFNIGTGVGTPVIDLATNLLRIAGANVPVEYAPARAGEPQHSFLDVSKAAEVLGWRPGTQLATGLAETFRSFESRHESRAVRA